MREPFSSPGKAAVRARCLELVQGLAEDKNDRLSYLGLPSPWMGDVESWKGCLGSIYAVERKRSLIPHMIDRAYTLGVLDKLRYFCGDIDEILLRGIDDFGAAISEVFPVDLVNLDYCGGLVYEGFERLAALEALLTNQREGYLRPGSTSRRTPFLLFVTHQVHSRASGDLLRGLYQRHLEHLTRDLGLYEPSLRQELAEAVSRLGADASAWEPRHKVFVLGKLVEWAEARGFQVCVRGITSYIGDHETRMMNYRVCVLPEALAQPVPANSGVRLRDILNFPVEDAG